MAKRPPAAQTALGPMVIAAIEQLELAERRIVTDPLAVRFLPPTLALMVRACRWRPLRDSLIRATDKKAHGIWGGVLCRKRYADDQVTAAVEADDLMDSLTANGFQLSRPTMFVWEAVTQYLTEEGVRRTLALLAKAATGSRLVFTFVRRDFLDGANSYQAEGAYRDFVIRQRVWHFGLAPDEVAGLLDEYGWVEREQVGATEYQDRYLRPVGRDLPVSEIERFVFATKPERHVTAQGSGLRSFPVGAPLRGRRLRSGSADRAGRRR